MRKWIVTASVSFGLGLIAGFYLGTHGSWPSDLRSPVGDWIVFPLFEIVIATIIIYAILHDKGVLRPTDASNPEVVRGELSRNALYVAFGMVELVLIHVVNSTSAWEGHKTICHLFNLLSLGYFVFFSSWGRNKVIGILVTFRQWVER